MPKFGKESLIQLSTCDLRIQKVMTEAIKEFDFTVLEGHRGKEAQNAAYAKGNSKLRWPHGNHNSNPSRAVDIAPYPIDWSNKLAAQLRFAYLAGHVMSIARRLDIPLRWGGDWNRNQDPRDETFLDLPHFELDEDA
jgi:peptidoglycan LD-endopeptidase CwlK